MAEPREILIISRNFPPMGGVGTRRWSKFAKYFARKGYQVHVLTIGYGYRDIINWSHDVEDPNIRIHRVKGSYPQFLLQMKKRGFLMKKFTELLKLMYKMGPNWMDTAQGWEKRMLPYARKLIRERGIKNVMVTAAPFSVAYMSSFLKVENPDINLIVDMRDSWNDDIYYEYGTTLKSFKRKEQSAMMELAMMTYADKVVFVTETTKKRNAQIYKCHASRFRTIYNGYDPDDFEGVVHTGPEEEGRIRLVYFGSIASGRQEGLHSLLRVIKEMDDPFFREHLQIDIYGRKALNFRNPYPEICHFKGFVAPTEIAGIIAKSSICLSINSLDHSYSIGTKVFEYMGMNMPLMHLSDGGELSGMLEQKGQYVSDYKPENLEKMLLRYKANRLSGKSTSSDYPEFDIAGLTQQMEDLFVW